MKRWLLPACLVSLAAFAGCSKSGSGDGKLRIAVIPKGTVHEFWKAGEAGAKAAGEELGVTVIWKGPQKESDRAGQIKTMENFINQGVDGIALAPLDSKALVRPVMEAHKAGIKVAVWDSGLDDSAADALVSFIATDNRKAGRMCGEKLAELVGESGKVIMLRHAVGHASTTNREEGFLEGIKAAAPGVELISVDQRGGTTIDEAIQKSQVLLNQYGDEITGVFTPNESVTQGMLRALQDAELAGKVHFVGFDVTDTLLTALREGEIAALAVQNPFKMGNLAVKHLVSAIRGEEVDSQVDTGAVLVTLDNVDSPEVVGLLSPGKQ